MASKVRLVVRKRWKWFLVGGLLLVVLVAWGLKRTEDDVSLTTVLTDVGRGQIEQIIVDGDGGARAKYKSTQGRTSWVAFRTQAGVNLYELLSKASLPTGQLPRFTVERPSLWRCLRNSVFFQSFLAILLAGGLLIGLGSVLISKLIDSSGLGKSGQAQQEHMEGMMRSGWQWIAPRFSLTDIGGLDANVKAQVSELTRMLKEPGKFQTLGARVPRGILLAGPSGVGKTMLAHSIAKELGFQMCIVFSSVIVGPYIGLAALRVNNIFEEARKKGRCVVFFDEVEMLAARRSSSRISSADTEIQSTVIQLMLEFDREENNQLIILGATNRIEVLEPALLRMGRFERQLFLDLPDVEGRLEILQIHSHGKPLAREVTLSQVARERTTGGGTTGFSGADLAEARNEAASNAGVKNQSRINKENLGVALTRVRDLMRRHSINDQNDGMQRALFEFYEKDGTAPTFASVGGLRDAKERLAMMVDFLRNPDAYTKAQCRIPKGVLLGGPPGIGKTLLARAVAGEAGVSFIFTSGSAFLEMWAGVAAARVRDLFRVARRQSPCIVFIDEIDALGGARSGLASDMGGAARDFNQALTALLTEMDGFRQTEGIVVMAATNRTDILDPALVRPGRFDYVVQLELPDEKDRREILEIYLKKSDKLMADDRERLVQFTQRKSGADMESLINTARIHAVRDRKAGIIEWLDVEYALTSDSRNQRGLSPL